MGIINMLGTITGSLKIDAGTAGATGFSIPGSGVTPVVIPAGKTFVRLEFPNIKKDFSATTFNVYLNSTGPDAPATTGGTVGTFKVGAVTTTINGGSVYIYLH